jgi:hypothetical protein
VRGHALLAGALLAGAVFIRVAAGADVAWSSYLVGSAGLALLLERLRHDGTSESALFATLLIFAATSLFWVMVHRGGLWESVSFSLVAAALWAEDRWSGAAIVRRAVWITLALLPLAIRFLLAERGPGVPWDQPLFSSSQGLLSLTPVVYLALAGTVADARREPQQAFAMLAAFAAWLVAAAFSPVVDPGRHWSHGLTPAVALLAPGLVRVIDAARRRPWPAVTLLLAAAFTWNYLLMVQYTIGLVPKDAPVSFRALVRQQADVLTRQPYIYPFAFPANVWFAWREHVPVDRYELLAFEPRRDRLDLSLSPDASRFLLDGWEPRASESAEPLAWTRDRRATLAVPLALPERRPIDIVISARARLDDPPVNVTLGVEVNDREIGRVIVPPAAVADLRLSIGAEVGSVFRAGYNRLALVSHGVARVDAADSRPPGSMASRLGDRPWPVAVHRIRIGVREP